MMRRAFKRIDTTNKGVIPLTDFKNILKKLSGVSLSDEDVSIHYVNSGEDNINLSRMRIILVCLQYAYYNRYNGIYLLYLCIPVSIVN